MPTADRSGQRAEGVTVHEVRSWRTHNRNSKGPWGPVNGVMIHHTVTSGTASSVDLCYDGHANLPGPLCHGVIDKKGHVHLVGNGRANHAGLGDGDVLRAVINESKPPADNEADTDGNRHFYGFECINLGNGRDPWPEAQKEAIERVSAAICRHHGWSERSVIGHKEWQPGKVDPRGFTMDGMRSAYATGSRVPGAAPSRPPTRSRRPSRPTNRSRARGSSTSGSAPRSSRRWAAAWSPRGAAATRRGPAPTGARPIGGPTRCGSRSRASQARTPTASPARSPGTG